MYFLIVLIPIVQGALVFPNIFPNLPYQFGEIQWIQCEPPNQLYQFSIDNQHQQYYTIDEKSMCQNITDLQIIQGNFDQLQYCFIFAKNIENELIISIDGIRYYVDEDKLKNKRQVVILHKPENSSENNFPISIKGEDNQFLQLYILQQFDNVTQVDQILYNGLNNSYKTDIKLLSLETNILNQTEIVIIFTFELSKFQQLLCHFYIPESENIAIHNSNDSLIQLQSKFSKERIHKIGDFIYRINSSVEIQQIFGGTNNFTIPFDLIFITDGDGLNTTIQTFLNETNEKMTLPSHMIVQYLLDTSTLIIQINPSGIECPSNLIITHLQITNSNQMQWTQIQNQNVNNCQIQIQIQFTDDGVYQVVLSAQIKIEDLTFYLENQDSFSIKQLQSVQYHLGMVLGMYFGIIILFIFVFIVFSKQCGMAIYNRLDTMYYMAIFVEEENQNLQ